MIMMQQWEIICIGSQVVSVEIRLGWIFGLTPPPNLGTVLHKSCLEIQSQIQSVLAIIVQLDKNAARFK